jgi:TrmH family RNA methyltransferase
MLAKSRVKYIQTLGQKKFRDAEKVFIAEGPKIVDELLNNKTFVVQEVLATEDWMNLHDSDRKGTTFTTVTEDELQRISQLKTPHSVLAIVSQIEQTVEDARKNAITLLLDDLQDPGNMGTIIRLADWFDISAIICSKHCADIYNPKVVQASMGSMTRVRLSYTNLREWLTRQQGIAVYAAVMNGESLVNITAPPEAICIIGNEGNGINSDLLSVPHLPITIPRKGGGESLNAAMATAIILSRFCL